jgi:hypothetical protein
MQAKKVDFLRITSGRSIYALSPMTSLVIMTNAANSRVNPDSPVLDSTSESQVEAMGSLPGLSRSAKPSRGTDSYVHSTMDL